MVQQGDRVDVVLDVFSDDDAYRVVMVGVFRPGQPFPEPAPGAQRNVVQTWFETAHNFGAFRLGIGK